MMGSWISWSLTGWFGRSTADLWQSPSPHWTQRMSKAPPPALCSLQVGLAPSVPTVRLEEQSLLQKETPGTWDFHATLLNVIKGGFVPRLLPSFAVDWKGGEVHWELHEEKPEMKAHNKLMYQTVVSHETGWVAETNLHRWVWLKKCATHLYTWCETYNAIGYWLCANTNTLTPSRFLPPLPCRFILLKITLAPFKDFRSHPGHFELEVTDSTSIQALKELINDHLGGVANSIALFKEASCSKQSYLVPSWCLQHCGMVGGSKMEPVHAKVFYDYMPPVIDCPILMSDDHIKEGGGATATKVANWPYKIIICSIVLHLHNHLSTRLIKRW